ncbi:hypothetical protein HKX48_005387 [Thoreauomyces humboldtii]|nr:hypothetical protein HKX48_005387 [Thoreauomyces humboldtii]
MKDFEKGLTKRATPLDGTGLRILIVHTRWNLPVVSALVTGAQTMLLAHNVDAGNITIKEVAGCFELPFAVSALLSGPHPKYDAAIAVGVLIKGSTMHFEYIADATTSGLMRVGLDTGRPVIFGVLTCLTEDQARERAALAGAEGNEGHNHGEDWGTAAVEMAVLNRERYKSIGATLLSAMDNI